MLESGKERILIFAPHSDDEVLGCAGLIEKACRLGNSTKVIIGSISDSFFWHSGNVVTVEHRKEELKNALEVLGCYDFEVLYEGETNPLDMVPQRDVVMKIDKILMEYKPTIVLIPYPSFHQDHQLLFNACMAGLRPVPGRNYKMIAMFEYPLIVWQYPKINNVGELYLDISETIDKKIEALYKHESQIRNSEHLISPEKVRQWAEKRGLEAGVRYAEKYHLLKAFLI
ncbi:N-acetylglucosaminyl deacetylase, LmbE family [Bacillus sp. OV166]|uniref:PIG-L deacetylase family protein n=1 Tax=Bacillus sp. OV166 TaxID=1882763 RepID=UPI000A2ACC48|nr:PIG-L deacetylase family protein [Bacillus sp. OV166]SMQ75991.1 N-acetylglucosaminyl deacetylase, LmbE family [Bacillus sp. OV166]